MKVVCPKCKTVYSTDVKKIDFKNKKTARCIKCRSLFYVQKKENVQNGVEELSGITFLQSYFEKRKGHDRRKSSDRRKKVKTGDLPFMAPSKDIIFILNDEDLPIGYTNNGKRKGTDRRKGSDRRDIQELNSKPLLNN